MKYQSAVNIWDLNDQERAALQIGQWVYAGERSNMGRFYGQGRSTVVAWCGNGRGRWVSYTQAIRDYARGVRGNA